MFGIFDIFRKKEKPRNNFTKGQKEYRLEKQNYKCANPDCRVTIHDVDLEKHHKDGDRENNSTANLEILCPNCHTNKTKRQQKSRNKKKKKRKELGLGDLSLNLGLDNDKPKKKKRTSSHKTKTKKKSKQSDDGFSWLEYKPDSNTSRKSRRKKKDDGFGWLLILLMNLKSRDSRRKAMMVGDGSNTSQVYVLIFRLLL